jgi:protein-tyrosine phosphatase
MDDDNYSDITAMARNKDERSRVVMMTDFLRNHTGHTSVPDPYYGGDRGFELVIELLEDACEGLLEQVIKDLDIR